MLIKLTEEDKANIHQFLQQFKKYLKSKNGIQDQEQRKDQAHFFQQELPSRLSELAESDVLEIVHRLWSTQIWGNKQYLVQELIKNNGLDGISKGFKNILQRNNIPSQRYEDGLGKIHGLGPAAVTEILCYSDPDNCGIWNRRAREAISILGLDRFVSPNKYKLLKSEYERFNDLAKSIASQLVAEGIQADLLTVDFFLYEVGLQASKDKNALKKEPGTGSDFDHDEIRDLVKNIGALLGFDVQTEIKIAHGAQVDVIWRAAIGNLGKVTYVFEVHKSGSIDSLLLNLQKARSATTVQKVIAISDQKQLDSIAKECEGLPEEFRKTLAYWPVNDVLEVSKSLMHANELIDKLGLVPVL